MHDVTEPYVLLQHEQKEAASLRRNATTPAILLTQVISFVLLTLLSFLDGGVEGSKYDIQFQDSSDGKYRYELHLISSTFVGAMATCQSRGQGQGFLTPMATNEEIELVMTLLSLAACSRSDWTDEFIFIGLTTLGNQHSLGFLNRPRPGSSTDLLRLVSHLDVGFANSSWPDSSSQASAGTPPSAAGSSVLSGTPVQPLCAAISLLQYAPSTQDSDAVDGAQPTAIARSSAVLNSMCGNNSGMNVSYPLELYFHDCDGGVPHEDGVISTVAEHAFVCRIPAPTPPPPPPLPPSFASAPMASPLSPSSPQALPPEQSTILYVDEQHSETVPPLLEGGGVPREPESQTSEPGYPPSPEVSSTALSLPAARRQARVLRAGGQYSRFLLQAGPSATAPQPPSRTPFLPAPAPSAVAPVPAGASRMPSSPSTSTSPSPSPSPPLLTIAPNNSSPVGMARQPPMPAKAAPPVPSPKEAQLSPPPPSGSSVASPQPPGTLPLSNVTTGLSAVSVMTKCDSEVIDHGGVVTHYLACHIAASWSESAQLCAELLLGGTLAIFESQAQMDKVSNAFSRKDLGGMYNFWFGLASGATLEQPSNESGLPPLEYVLTDPRVVPVLPSQLWISGGLRLDSSCRANPEPPLPPESPPGPPLPPTPPPSRPPPPRPSSPARSPSPVPGSSPALSRASGCCGSLAILPVFGSTAAEGSSSGGQALLRACYHKIKFICQAPRDLQPGDTAPVPFGPSESGGSGASTLLSSLFLDALETTYRGDYRVFRAQLELQLVGAPYDALLLGDGESVMEDFRNETARQLSLSTRLPAWSFEVLQLRNGSIVAAINLTVRGLPRTTLVNFTQFVRSALVGRQPLELFSSDFVGSWSVQQSLVSVLGLWELSAPQSPPSPDPSSNRVLIVIVSVSGSVVLAGAAVALLLVLRRRKLRRGTPVYLASLDNDELQRHKTLTSISPPPSLQQPRPPPLRLEVSTPASPANDALLLGRALANPLLSPLRSSSLLRLGGLSSGRDTSLQSSPSGRVAEGWAARPSVPSRDGSEAGARIPGGGDRSVGAAGVGAAAAFSGIGELAARTSGRLTFTPSLSASRENTSRLGTISFVQGPGLKPHVGEALEPSGLTPTGATTGLAVSNGLASLYDNLAVLKSPIVNRITPV